MVKMSKSERDGYIADVNRANEMLAKTRASQATTYDKAVLSYNSTNFTNHTAHVAKKLSEKYPHFKISIAFEDGIQSIFMEPTFKPFTWVDIQDYNLQTLVTTALAHTQKTSSLWPIFEETAAFARGYSDGLASFMKLEQENFKLKSDLDDARKNPMMMHPMMMHPFYRG